MKPYITEDPTPETADCGQTGYEPLCGEEVATPVPRLQTILVPVDFTPDSEKSLTYAVCLAKQFGARITLLHVSQVQFCGTEFAYMPIEDWAICEGVRTRLDALVERKVGLDLLGATLVRHGVCFEVITCVAREINADMIVVSTHGYTGLKHLMAGSTAERVVRHAPCPVLVVHPQERDFV
jgi:nucleotide-binding universal stress UspA family protein